MKICLKELKMMTCPVILVLLYLCMWHLKGCIAKREPGKEPRTFTNPLNLNYRFDIEEPSHRTAADPVIVLFKEKYYLFASKAGGYWVSDNLLDWKLIETADLPLERYAPTVIDIDGTLFFMANTARTDEGTYPPQVIYSTDDPLSGKWHVTNPSFPMIAADPAFFRDSDGRVFLYYGLGRNGPIKGVELDVNNNLNPIGDIFICIVGRAEERGWERRGDYNEQHDSPFIEGAWMNKHKERYYLQYAAPGTQFKGYADGVYTSLHPKGPFSYDKNNPFSIKPEGFVNGAGHGCTFQDKHGNWWHVATTVVAVRHHWERRIGLFPAAFDADGHLYTSTGFADYPLFVPQKKIKSPEELFTQWMLLSYNKPHEVSSSINNKPGANAFDEKMKTYWSAKTGNYGEFIKVDLEDRQEVLAVQINYAEHLTSMHGRDTADYHQYLLLASNDDKEWSVLVDKTTSKDCIPHDFIQLEKPVKTRFLKLVNYHVPDGTFALSGLRIFGKGHGAKPDPVDDVTIKRNKLDLREVEIVWKGSAEADGYLVRFGTEEGKLYQSQISYANTSLKIRRLNKGSTYCFAVDAFNENGITHGQKIFY